VRRVLEHAIDELPETFRLVFLMRNVEELSIEETAAQLDISPETVKTRLHRARKLLRQHLDEKLASVLKDTFPFEGALRPHHCWCHGAAGFGRPVQPRALVGNGAESATGRGDEGLGMTTELAGNVCTPCQGGVAPLGPDEAARYLAEVPGWTLADEGSAIKRTYRFGNFREALAFADRVGALAESEGHHPDICFGWGYAKVSLQRRRSKACTKTTSSWPRRSDGAALTLAREAQECRVNTASVVCRHSGPAVRRL
jgi:4a-hydroxytetrahydrobiopterin dehydratase